MCRCRTRNMQTFYHLLILHRVIWAVQSQINCQYCLMHVKMSFSYSREWQSKHMMQCCWKTLGLSYKAWKSAHINMITKVKSKPPNHKNERETNLFKEHKTATEFIHPWWKKNIKVKHRTPFNPMVGLSRRVELLSYHALGQTSCRVADKHLSLSECMRWQLLPLLSPSYWKERSSLLPNYYLFTPHSTTNGQGTPPSPTKWPLPLVAP